jgi:hypothetical protein
MFFTPKTTFSICKRLGYFFILYDVRNVIDKQIKFS